MNIIAQIFFPHEFMVIVLLHIKISEEQKLYLHSLHFRYLFFSISWLPGNKTGMSCSSMNPWFNFHDNHAEIIMLINSAHHENNQMFMVGQITLGDTEKQEKNNYCDEIKDDNNTISPNWLSTNKWFD